MAVKVKVCGITSVADALLSCELGADLLGLIFANSPRRISVRTAAEISMRLSGKIALVGVFSDPDDPGIIEVCERAKLDMLQIYFPDKSNGFLSYPLPVLPSYWITEETDISRIERTGSLLDFKGAPGLLESCEVGKMDMSETILAGGFNIENVGRIVETLNPLGVDVARGVESEPGKKDRDKLERFIRAVKS